MRTLLKSASVVFLMAFCFMLGMLSSRRPISASGNAPANSPEQITVFQPCVTPTATATRTPTPVNIGNFVWNDIDHDGRQDAGEPGISGVTVQLWNSTKTALLDSAVTNASGNYTVIAPLPGNYRIRVLLPNNMDSFSPKDQAGGDNQLDSDINPSGASFGFTDSFNLANNVISTTIHDAGIVVFRTPTPTRTPTPINIGNYVWEDYDHDGRQDAGEPGLSGVTVQLWNASKTDLIAQTTTNASGGYTVIAPLPGNYRIRVLLPSNTDSFTGKNQAGGDDQLDSDINPSGANFGFTDSFNLASNVISTTIYDAGIQRFYTPTPTRTPTPVAMGNFVWDDLNGNGQQEVGEPGLSGVTVQLWNASKTQLLAQTTTNGSGLYTLIAPFPGSYRVRVLLSSSSHSFTLKDQASGNDQSDSDINPSGVDFGFTDVIDIASNVISTTVIDAGINTPLIFNGDLPLVQPLASTTLVFNGDVPLVQPLISPTPSPTLPARVDTNICARFRLTSPVEGLPNGTATFYWDPAEGQGITYQVTIMDEGHNVLATYSTSDATSVQGDISQQRIGGGFQMVVQVSALQNGQVICTDERTILRAAPDPGNLAEIRQPPAVPTPTPRRGQG